MAVALSEHALKHENLACLCSAWKHHASSGTVPHTAQLGGCGRACGTRTGTDYSPRRARSRVPAHESTLPNWRAAIFQVFAALLSFGKCLWAAPPTPAACGDLVTGGRLRCSWARRHGTALTGRGDGACVIVS